MKTDERFKVEVHTVSCAPGVWTGNGMTFKTQEDAHLYGSDLGIRWTALDDFRVIDIASGEAVEYDRCGLTQKAADAKTSERSTHI